MSNARLRLAFAAATIFPPRAPFFLRAGGGGGGGGAHPQRGTIADEVGRKHSQS